MREYLPMTKVDPNGRDKRYQPPPVRARLILVEDAHKNRVIDQIKARRRVLGLGIEEVAAHCGIAERLLSDWEQGSGSPQLDVVERWAAMLGLRLSFTADKQDVQRGIKIDWANRCIAVDGRPVRLTALEWNALERLAAVPGEPVSSEALFHHLYGARQPYRATSTALRVLITRLRRLLPLQIKAQRGCGYVISGIEPSGLGLLAIDHCPAEPAVEHRAVDEARGVGAAARPRREGIMLVTGSTSDATSARSTVPTPAGAPVRRTAAPRSVPNRARAEELGIIERFLAERGATRCPDAATLRVAMLPMLIWDKSKRKWVRPTMPPHAAPTADARIT